MLDRTPGHVLAVALSLSGILVGCTQTIRVEEQAEDDVAATYGMTSGPPTPGNGSTGSAQEEESSSEGGSASGDAQGGSSDGGGALCGDGVIQGLEDCDCGEGNICAEKELGGQGCLGLDAPEVPGVITGGVLLCNGSSCRYDTANCFYCGDGYLNGNETCEDGFEIETSCEELGMGLGELSCGDDCQLDTSDCNACGYIFDFDSGDCPGDWTTGRTTNAAAPTSWECGATNGFEDGPGFEPSRIWATSLTGTYQSNESSYVASGAIDLDGCTDQSVTMTLRHWFSFGLNDGGIVQAATSNPDDESSWTTIEPVSGSFYSATVAANHAPIAGNPAFSTHDPAEQTWVEAVFDITEYAGEDEFYLRFVFGTDDGDVAGGWYVDRIEIHGTPR